ncbi:MAG: hypothetical protein JWQ84_1369, partial [Mucilaginibacter sp.]|nr:hypothetical protein [Mucilaginibacter sp.]
QNYDKDLVYGIIAKKKPKDFQIPESIKDKIKILPNNTPKNNIWWSWFKRLEEPYNDWSKFPAWNAILDNRMRENIIEKIKYLLEITKDLEM